MTESLAKKLLLEGVKYETDQRQSDFMDGVRFMKDSIWHEHTEVPEEDCCVFAYNPETDDYDLAYYVKVPKGYRWAYLEDFFTDDMVKGLKEHEKAIEAKFR